MLVREMMTSKVMAVHADWDIKRAAIIMREEDIGVLPVIDGNTLVGIITDRDMVVGVIAEGRNPDSTLVQQIMSEKIYYCFHDQPFEAAADMMAEKKVRRLPVLNRDMQIVGIVSLGDIPAEGEIRTAGELPTGIAERPA